MFLVGENEENDFALKILYPNLLPKLKLYFFSKTYGFIVFITNFYYTNLIEISEKYCKRFSKYFNPFSNNHIKSVIYNKPVREMKFYYSSQLFYLC